MRIKSVLIFFFILFSLSCSRGEEPEKKNPREDNVLIKAIRTPLDKASGAKATADQRSIDIDQAYDELEEVEQVP